MKSREMHHVRQACRRASPHPHAKPVGESDNMHGTSAPLPARALREPPREDPQPSRWHVTPAPPYTRGRRRDVPCTLQSPIARHLHCSSTTGSGATTKIPTILS